MNEHSIDSLNQTIARIRHRFINEAQSCAERLSAALALYKNNKEEGQQQIATIVHSLAGSGSTFGFPEISEISGNIELAFLQDPDSETIITLSKALILQLKAVSE